MSAPQALRIACLVPSITELLVDLGLRPWLVARTGFCIHPAEALRDVPKVGGTKDVNLSKLQHLAPTHVIVNVDENRLDTFEALRAFVPEILVTHPQGPADNLALLAQLSEAFGAVAQVALRAQQLAQELEWQLQAMARIDWRPQRVLYLIWREPFMAVAQDTYISRMLAQVGWQTWPCVRGGEQGAARYPVITGHEAWLAEVDQVLLSSEPYRFETRHVAEAQALCPRAQVRLVDGELLSWYGPRAAQGLRYLAQIALV